MFFIMVEDTPFETVCLAIVLFLLGFSVGKWHGHKGQLCSDKAIEPATVDIRPDTVCFWKLQGSDAKLHVSPTCHFLRGKRNIPQYQVCTMCLKTEYESSSIKKQDS